MGLSFWGCAGHPLPMELPGFSLSFFEHEGYRRPVYQQGSGPGVVLIHEVPGITPEVAGFARRVADQGLTAVLPSLFGVPGKPFTLPYVVGQALSLCVRREFNLWSTSRTSPIITWLRALAREVHQQKGGPGVGAIGMCFSGGFALAMMTDPSVVAAGLSQPSLPIPLTPARKRDLGLSPPDLELACARAAAGVPVMGLRFTRDFFVPDERFDALKESLGKAFTEMSLDSSPGNPWGFPLTAHSVLTMELRDREGHPTREALERVLTMFREALLSSPPV